MTTMLYSVSMPGRNLTRISVPNNHYHVYNRGIDKNRIFLDAADYRYFELLFARHLLLQTVSDRLGRPYKWLHDDVKLEAYCLMPSHFHLVLYQISDHGVADLMLSIGTAYTMYFNRKYHRRGPLYENTYRASLISDDAYLQHITRYVHLNPKQYKSWVPSSYNAYAANSAPEWMDTTRILALFSSRGEYRQFVSEYESAKESVDLIKHELADNI